jgi:transcription elongation factor Elf1
MARFIPKTKGRLPMASNVNCDVCGGDTFSVCDYVTREATCPALECAKCGAITLDEEVARSSDERESVREMLAARARILVDAEIAHSRASI